MFKILLIALNFLNVFNYQIIKQEEIKYEEIIYQDEDYIIYNDNSEIKLKTTNDEWIRDLNVQGQIDAFLINNKLYILNYDNGKFKGIIYGRDGKLIKEILVFENPIHNYKIIYDKYFYLVGSISYLSSDNLKYCVREGLLERNGIILKFDNELEIIDGKLYGGELNDEFFDICSIGEFLIVAGKKDVLTSGDFGNGGKNDGDIFLAKFSLDLELINFVIINDNSKIIGLDYFKDYIYFCSSKYIYKLDSDLNFINSNELQDQAMYFILAYFNKLVVVSKNNIYLYDIFTFEKIETLDVIEEIKEIKEFKNILYVLTDKYYYYDFACLDGIKYLDPYNSDITPIFDVKTLYGKASYLSDVGDVVFEPLVYGTYLRKLKFINIYGIEFVVDRECNVPRLVNVSEGGIYPVGYNLKFTGRAYLNGMSILNNYQIVNAGNYDLKLVGANNEEHNISFIVDNAQIKFEEEKIEAYHNVVSVGDVYYINIKYESEIDAIKSVIIDDEEYFDLLVKKDKKIISIKMNPKFECGVTNHIINGIYYYKQNGDESEEYYLNIDKVFVVNVINKVMNVTINQIDDFEFLINLDDKNTARYFLLTYYYNNEEYIYKYPITSNKVFIESIPQGNINAFFQIYYDLGDKSYQKIDLFAFEFKNLSDNSLLEIDVLKREESLEEFKLKVVNNKVKSIRINNNLIFEKVNKDYTIHLIIGLILLVITFSIIYKIRLRRKLV